AGLGAQASENVLGSEVEILTSWDLAVQAAEAIGPNRLLPHASGNPSKEAAAKVIDSGLVVTVHKGSNIIFVAYKSHDPSPATVMVPRSFGATAGKLDKEGPSAAEIPSEVKQQYQVLISRLPQLRQAKLDLLAKYMPKSKLVKANQAEIDDVTRQCRKLEKE